MHRTQVKINKFKIYKRKIKRNCRGISPIVAEMLLIGLTMLAGVITFGTVMVVLNSKEPIVVSIDSFSGFKLTDSTNSTRYNTFSFVLDNQGKRDAGVKASDFKLYNVTAKGDILLANWTMSHNYQLNSLQSYYVTIVSTSTNTSNWLSFDSTIKIQLVAYGLDQPYSSADKVTEQATTTISSSMVAIGPMMLKTNYTGTDNANYAALDSTNPNNNSLRIDILNYGNLPVNYTLDFIVSSINVTIKNTYSKSTTNLGSMINGYLPAANGNNPSSTADPGSQGTIIFTVTSTKFAPADLYYVIVWLKIDTNIQDSLMISC